MKEILTGFMIIGAINFGQCSSPNATEMYSWSGVSAEVANDGRMFYVYQVPANSGKTLWYSPSLWISALDASGSLKTAGYLNGNGTDFYSGPLDQGGEVDGSICNVSNRIFRLDRLSVDVFRNLLNVPGFVIEPDILEWPAMGNLNAEFEAGAPFVDMNGDLIHSALDGDYPAFSFDGTVDMDNDLLSDQCLWYVINDKGNTHTETEGDQLGVQIQCMVYGFGPFSGIEGQSFSRAIRVPTREV